MKQTISLCMIVKDEEKNLKDFLIKIKNFVDEIIIVDTGSKDKTKDIAKKFTKKIYGFEWDNDFSKARNLSISKATKEWILVLDPDEKISENGLIKIKDLIQKNKEDTLGYRLIQKTYYKNKIISIRGICRIFKNKKEIRFDYPIHETVRPSIKKLKAKIGKTGITIEHHPKIDKEKQKYYLKLLKTKKENFPKSNADKEIENEYNLFNPH